MPVRLHGSCRCGAVRFALDSHTPQPYQLCYCSICRKTAGGGGYAINLAGDYATLEVGGRDAIAVFRADIDGTVSTGERNFCTRCGTPLWLYDPQWPELVHPFASAIDTELPKPPERVHLMLGSKANWVIPYVADQDDAFDGYPDESIEDWHRARGLWVE